MPVLRVRGLPLSLSAIAVLHIYWVSVQFGCMIGALMPGDIEYWIMGTYLPCGIALFHASNSQFLYVAALQKKYVHYNSRCIRSSPGSRPKPSVLGNAPKLFIIICISLLCQSMVPKWNRSQRWVEGGNGKKWPGIFWQVFWSWIFAPIILWKSRRIHDTQGWRVQTLGCAIANLHATPMWLIALYVPAMKSVNQYWRPPQWICLSILVIEIFTVLIPCWEVRRNGASCERMRNLIAQKKLQHEMAISKYNSLSPTFTIANTATSDLNLENSTARMSNDTRHNTLTLTSLDYILEQNPTPQRFAALHDFSGENIAFLVSVSQWKNSLQEAVQNGTVPRADCYTREQFNQALSIYVDFVSVYYAEFPVNISSRDLKRLEVVFEGPGRALYGNLHDVNPATPFETPDGSSKARLSPVSLEALSQETPSFYMGAVPETFNTTVFDDAQDSIKYLVLTNTWPKFVKNHLSLADSSDIVKADMGFV
ncbi:hypothetical protein BDV38DRAFT_275102 [Aspergillus pseudotamarii]|uniref:RGS domain-containing protein n=1 Tax=Aspergillus pseudotamarii TaxID=132259 RepID=A0A5N6SCH6_ASPPS|nr:uncharacterized protein BDV38DRAFT_275102 [Aspergillus pseudotamarii]KAE8132418.1 hypothetical protein BDV38DRAFT_275102 [Aspergillus pseudotamarii]